MAPLSNLLRSLLNKPLIWPRWSILGLIVFAVTTASANPPYNFNFEGELLHENKPLFVSLGSGCDQGIALRDCGLRYAAFPFDWLICGNHRKFIALLDDDFAFFTDENYFEPFARYEGHPNILKNSYYDLIFRHEGTENYAWWEQDKYQQQLTLIKEKYTRRIERFRQLRQYPGKVFFIRNFTWDEENQVDHNNEQALELKDVLASYFPELNFTLIVVTYMDTNAPPLFPIENVIEFHLNRGPWRDEYKKMYQALLDLESSNLVGQ